MKNSIIEFANYNKYKCFYGKHASRVERCIKQYNFDKEIICFKTSHEDETYSDITYESNQLFAINYASGVTAHGRTFLRETARNVGQDKFVYADTDSLKFEMDPEELEERLKEYNSNCLEEEKMKIVNVNTDEKLLGLFELEYTFKDIKTIGQKKYMYTEDGLEWHTKCAGLPEEIRDEIKCKEDFEIGREYIKPQKQRVVGGYQLVDTPYCMSDFCRL